MLLVIVMNFVWPRKKKKTSISYQRPMYWEVRVCCSCKRCCYHSNENGDYNQACYDPQNAKHTTESGLGGTITVAVDN